MARAAELATALGDIPRQAGALELLGYNRIALGETRQAAKLSSELQTLAERIPGLHPQAIHLMGIVALRMGEFGKAERNLTAAAFEWARTPAQTGRAGHALATKGVALWALGFPDQALEVAEEALARADHADTDQYARVVIRQWVGEFNRDRGELAAADDLFHKARALAVQHGFPVQVELLRIFIALVSAWRGPSNDLAHMWREVERILSSWATWATPSPWVRNVLAQVYAFEGNVDAALASLGSAIGRRTGRTA